MSKNSSPLFYPLPPFYPMSILNYFSIRSEEVLLIFVRVYDLYPKNT